MGGCYHDEHSSAFPRVICDKNGKGDTAKMQIVICDDDKADRETIHQMILQWEEAHQSYHISVREFHSSEELLDS